MTVPTHANQIDETRASLQRSEADLLVFISSVMNEQLDYARQTARETVEKLGLWLSVGIRIHTGQPRTTRTRILAQVAEADFVIWLVGKETTQPVANEINQCIAAQRRLLVLKLPTQDRDEQTCSLLDKVSGLAKWQDVAVITQLSDHIRMAFTDEIIRTLRDPTQNFVASDLGRCDRCQCPVVKPHGGHWVYPKNLQKSSRETLMSVMSWTIPELGAFTVEGPLGSGKTLAAHRLFQLATDRALEDSSQPFPILLAARDLDGSLREYIEKECKGYADPFAQGVFLLVDGVDDKGAREGRDLLRQASVYVDANSRATIVIITRPIPGLEAIGERVVMPALDGDKMVAVINRISAQELTLTQTYGWPASIREAAKLPLFAVMIGSRLRDNPDRMFSSRSRLIEDLAGDALVDAQENSEELDRLLHRLAACSITSGTRVRPSEVPSRTSQTEASDHLAPSCRIIGDRRFRTPHIPGVVRREGTS